ncbi:MAG: small multi-drug export protein [Clostridia bacterium]|nr:small multi-drug export protein [Clostridia bacterium]
MFSKIAYTFFIAMVPVIELRGALPIGVASGLDFPTAVIVSILGNLLPIPFIIIFIRKIFKWMREKSGKLDRLVEKLEAKAESKKAQVMKYEFWGLVILVAIPLPGTGAWTGGLVAAMMDMQIKRAMPAIALGVVIAAAIVAFVTYGAALAI